MVGNAAEETRDCCCGHGDGDGGCHGDEYGDSDGDGYGYGYGYGMVMARVPNDGRSGLRSGVQLQAQLGGWEWWGAGGSLNNFGSRSDQDQGSF